MERPPQSGRRRSSVRSLKDSSKQLFGGIGNRIESSIKRTWSNLTSSDKDQKSPSISRTTTKETWSSPVVASDFTESTPASPVVGDRRKTRFSGADGPGSSSVSPKSPASTRPGFYIFRSNMASSLDPRAALGSKFKQMQEARKMQQATAERAARAGVAVPPYEFLELIGKGTFGRVFKSKNLNTGELVAIKVIDVDKSDLKLAQSEMNGAIKDFVNEITVLQQLKDSRAKNINTIYETITLHSQLWIVSEYCPGGSVHTLMKASPKPGLEEEFIIPIARELAIALKHVHEAGVIHRDVKAANVLITEDGRLQLCDFGVAGMLESDVSKRSTIIGTPNWMPPEMQPSDGVPFDLELQVKYGTEIDCWAFGCTIYEIATGLPPNARVHPSRLGDTLKKELPRLEPEGYSKGLCDFVAFCLDANPTKRPNANAILQHAYIRDSSKKYPTSNLSKLLVRYAYWEQSGGQRASLFNPFGAAPSSTLDPSSSDDDSWNFSTTDAFDKRVSKMLLNPTLNFDELNSPAAAAGYAPEHADRAEELTPMQRAENEKRVAKGERSMARIFDLGREPYEMSNPGEPPEEEYQMSDLPFRNMATSDNLANRTTLIDLDAADLGEEVSLDMGDIPTMRASRFFGLEDHEDKEYEEEKEEEDDPYSHHDERRATRDWKFPTFDETPEESRKRRTQEWASSTMSHLEEASRNMEHNRRTQDWSFPLMQRQRSSFSDPEDTNVHEAEVAQSTTFRPKLKHTVTEPIGNFGDFLHPASSSKSDSPEAFPSFDLGLAPPAPSEHHRPSTPGSMHSSTYTESTNQDPFHLENLLPAPDSRRTSLHMHSQSEPPHTVSGLLTPSDHTFSASYHTRGNSLISENSCERARQSVTADEIQRASDFWDQHLDEQFATLSRPPMVPFLTRPEGPEFEGGNWEKYAPENMPPREESDFFGEPGDLVTPTSDDLGSTFGGFETLRAAIPTSSASRHPLPRSRSTTVSSRITSNAPENVLEFPHVDPPHPDVLRDDADPDLLLAETVRIFEGFGAHLAIAREFLAREYGNGNESS